MAASFGAGKREDPIDEEGWRRRKDIHVEREAEPEVWRAESSGGHWRYVGKEGLVRSSEQGSRLLRRKQRRPWHCQDVRACVHCQSSGPKLSTKPSLQVAEKE